MYGNQRTHCGNELVRIAVAGLCIYIGTCDRDRSRGAVVTSVGVVFWGGRRSRRGARNFNNHRRNSGGSARIASAGVAYGRVYVGRGEGMVGRCENAITRIVCVSAGRCECVRGARIITKYRELIKHIVGARRLDNRYKLPPRAKQLTGETRAYSTR